MGFLAGKRAVIVGLASNRSIAWGIAQAMRREGAELAFGYQNDKLKKRVEEMAAELGSDITLRCVELAGTVGYSEHDLLEKWARDSKILDIFEGTQQIQQLIVARRLLGKTSAELK